MELIRTTVGEALTKAASTYGDHEAAVFCQPNWRVTWKELDTLVDAVAKGLMAIGIRHGDHIGVWGTNVPEWLLTQLAAGRLGCPLVTINPEWRAGELEYALHQSKTRLLVTIAGFEKTSGAKTHRYDYVETLRSVCPQVFDGARADNISHLERIVLIADNPVEGLMPWSELVASGASISDADFQAAKAMVTPDDLAMIQYTSGTTGFPKGAMLSHFNILNNAYMAGCNMGIQAGERLCGPVPFYHCFGSILVNMCGLMNRVTIVIPSPHFNAHATLEAISTEGCHALHGVPTMFLGELDDPDVSHLDHSALRTGIMAGAPCPKELMEAVGETLGAAHLTIGYGLTEASPLTHQTLPKDPVQVRVTTVGRPLPHTEAKIVDPGNFTDLPDDEVGEIWTRGFHVMQGYFDKPQETDAAIVSGWLRTGDLGFRDKDGYFHIAGRLKELIIVGGHNVYPAEVEQTISSLFEKQIEQVQVVGIPHQKLQEVPAAVIKLYPGQTLDEAELKKRCQDIMEWPKVPRRMLIVDDFSHAMTVTGKIQKHKIRDWFMETSNAN